MLLKKARTDTHILSSVEMNPTLLKTTQNWTLNIQKMKSSKGLIFWSTIYLFSLVDGFSQQTVGIPMGTYCAPLHADLFWYSYEAAFLYSCAPLLADLFLCSYEAEEYMRRINLLLWPSVQHLDISTFYRSTMISSIHLLILYTPVILKWRTHQNHLLLLHTLLNIDAIGKHFLRFT